MQTNIMFWDADLDIMEHTSCSHAEQMWQQLSDKHLKDRQLEEQNEGEEY